MAKLCWFWVILIHYNLKSSDKLKSGKHMLKTEATKHSGRYCTLALLLLSCYIILFKTQIVLAKWRKWRLKLTVTAVLHCSQDASGFSLCSAHSYVWREPRLKPLTGLEMLTGTLWKHLNWYHNTYNYLGLDSPKTSNYNISKT